MSVLDVWSYDSLADGRKTHLLVVRKILCLSDLMNVSPYDCIADGHKKNLVVVRPFDFLKPYEVCDNHNLWPSG